MKLCKGEEEHDLVKCNLCLGTEEGVLLTNRGLKG